MTHSTAARAVFVGLVLTCACAVEAGRVKAQARSAEQRQNLLAGYLEALRAHARIPGLSVAVVRDQRIEWERGFGFQDLGRRVPATPSTPYRIASLTKTFTSMLLMGCVEKQRLDLDTPIRQYTDAIPEVTATVRHVFSHTSAGTPGATFRYDGNRYSALTPVVEACTGLPFRRALASLVLDPAAMRDSVPGQDLELPSGEPELLFDTPALERYRAVIARLAVPYTLGSNNRVVPADYPPRGINAAAGLISTVRDLASYDAAVDRNLLISAEARELAWTPFVTSAGPQPYALGWFVQRYRGLRLVWHYGSWPQFSALYLKVPDRSLTLILLANSGELSQPFPLALGDVTRSPFAAAFLKLYVD